MPIDPIEVAVVEDRERLRVAGDRGVN